MQNARPNNGRPSKVPEDVPQLLAVDIVYHRPIGEQRVGIEG